MNPILAKADLAFSKVYADYKKFVMYFAIGIIATLADWTLFFFLINAGIHFMYSVAFSYAVGMVISFFLNKRYTFQNTYQKVHYQFLSFAAVALVGLGLNEVLMYLFVDVIFSNSSGMYLMLARVIATFIVFIWNYIINKKITFHFFQ